MRAAAKIVIVISVASAASIFGRGATTVTNAINQQIGPLLTEASDDIKEFPASGQIGAFNISQDLLSLSQAFDATTVDVQSSGSFSEKDGSTILASFQALVPTFLGALSTLTSQKKAWATTLPNGQGFIIDHVVRWNDSSIAFMSSVKQALPDTLGPSADSATAQLSGAFTNFFAFSI
ncbi:hydrophobic surface binding protein A domain-containing protein [Pochonia chlamydosporia 170]|uniref:Hydrophobic surface binding protein A domain-containing protein n=1 Tax=Pochonia chlamydosporia 170 TaxID=1380566 RepID=A0A179FXQ0_METCM|nr:hydrophobic surface binding protein A domain-containing protein [Pochonia chlamydosporia 170]OAQ69960.1 hydrophobic surface binding protein A domain-containing protein [Pochonia chlamydosporia 170]